MKLHRSTVALLFASVFGHAAVSSAAVSQQISSEHLQFFENKIRPILATNCLECHSADKGKIKGGLNLDSKPDWVKGGESGALIKEGDVKGSTLIKAVTWEDDLQMPPKKKLTDEQIEDLKKWVRNNIKKNWRKIVYRISLFGWTLGRFGIMFSIVFCISNS